MKRTAVSVALVVLVLLILLAGHVNGQKSRGDAPIDAAIPVLSVSVAEVQPRPFRDEIVAVGTLVSHETALVSPRVPGNVEDVLVDIGDHVEKGQVLVRLDQTGFRLALDGARANLATTEATVGRAQAQQEHARREHTRAARLLAENVIPQSRLDAAEAAFKSAAAALDAARQQHELARTALQSAREHLADAEIVAPISGSVVLRKVAVGAAVAPGVILYHIVDQSALDLDIALPEKDFDRVQAGTPAELRIDAFEGRHFSGKVAVVNPMVSPATRTFLARISVANPDGALVDGMFARARLPLDTRRGLAVDREALQRISGSGTTYVFVINEGTLQRKTVTTGVIGDEFAEITAGLARGDRVVTASSGRLRAGARVKIDTVSPPDADKRQEA